MSGVHPIFGGIISDAMRANEVAAIADARAETAVQRPLGWVLIDPRTFTPIGGTSIYVRKAPAVLAAQRLTNKWRAVVATPVVAHDDLTVEA